MFRITKYVLPGMAALAAMQAAAGTLTFTDQAAFFAALPGTPSTLDFEAVPVHTAVPSGATISGISFDYSLGGLTMGIVDDFDTTSGRQSLGQNDPGNFDQFVAGDGFELDLLAPAAGVGLYFITTADPVFAGDIQLVTPAGTALNAGTPNLTLPDGGTAYFVGLISDTPFSQAGVQFDPGAVGAFLFNVDDITIADPAASAAPEPSGWLLCGGALALLAGGLRRTNPPE